MKRRWKILLLLLSLLLAGIIAAPYALLHYGEAKLQRIAKDHQMEIHWQKLDWTWSLGIAFQNLQLSLPQGISLSTERFLAHLSWSDLLHREVTFTDLQIQKAEVTLDLDRWQQERAQGASHQGRSSQWLDRLPDLQVEQANLHFLRENKELADFKTDLLEIFPRQRRVSGQGQWQSYAWTDWLPEQCDFRFESIYDPSQKQIWVQISGLDQPLKGQLHREPWTLNWQLQQAELSLNRDLRGTVLLHDLESQLSHQDRLWMTASFQQFALNHKTTNSGAPFQFQLKDSEISFYLNQLEPKMSGSLPQALRIETGTFSQLALSSRLERLFYALPLKPLSKALALFQKYRFDFECLWEQLSIRMVDQSNEKETVVTQGEGRISAKDLQFQGQVADGVVSLAMAFDPLARSLLVPEWLELSVRGLDLKVVEQWNKKWWGRSFGLRHFNGILSGQLFAFKGDLLRAWDEDFETLLALEPDNAHLWVQLQEDLKDDLKAFKKGNEAFSFFYSKFSLDSGKLQLKPLSREPIRDIDFEGEAEGFQKQDGGEFALSLHMKDLHLSSYHVLKSFLKSPTWEMSGYLDPALCQSAFSSLPPDLFGPYADAKLEGYFSGFAWQLSVPLDQPRQLKANLDELRLRDCTVAQLNAKKEAWPEFELRDGELPRSWANLRSDVNWLYLPFRMRPREGISEDADVIIGPGASGYVPLGQMPDFVYGAAYLSEEMGFFISRGVAPSLIKKALRLDLEGGRFVYGGSTVTQQLVKNLFLTREKTLVRKLREALIALRLAYAVDKRRILELYLNCIEFGPDIYGIGAAAEYYFQKKVRDLRPMEAIFLAMLKPSPLVGRNFKKRGSTPEFPYWFKRFDVLLERLVDYGYLTPEQAEIERPHHSFYWQNGQYIDLRKAEPMLENNNHVENISDYTVKIPVPFH